MTTELSFRLNVDNIIPHADAQASQDIISTWKDASRLCSEVNYQCVKPNGSDVSLQINVNLSDALALLEQALEQSESFNAYRELHSGNGNTRLGASLAFTLKSKEHNLSTGDAYHIGSTFQQQLYLAMNLAYPGACQFLGVKFDGSEAHLYEAQSFDSKIFYDARMSSHQQNWPKTQKFDITTTWNWLDEQRFSASDVAISDINKVLINMLKLAQQRHRYGSRSALLAAQQLELLLDCSHANCEYRLRKRASLVLGDIPEAADCFIELFRLRDDLFHGDNPIRRPALICYSAREETREQIASHNTTIELAAGIIVGLLQQLVDNKKGKYQFEERLI